MKLIDYYTWKTLVDLKKGETVNKWCNENGYLPHHKFGGAWAVIKK